jgi:hypothetical protein
VPGAELDLIQSGAEALAALGVRATATELIIPAQLPLDKWLQLMQGLGSIVQASAFYIGDGIIHGEAAYGQMYSQAMDELGMAEQTLTNYVYTCRHVKPANRRAELSFGHHSAVASLPEDQQVFWLGQAVEQGWGRTQLREAIKEAGLGRKALPASSTTPGHAEALDAVDAAAVEAGTVRPLVATAIPAAAANQLVVVADVARQLHDAALAVADVPNQLAATFQAVPSALLVQLGASLVALDGAALNGNGGQRANDDELVPDDDYPCTNVPPCAFVGATQEELWQHLRSEHGWK